MQGRILASSFVHVGRARGQAACTSVGFMRMIPTLCVVWVEISWLHQDPRQRDPGWQGSCLTLTNQQAFLVAVTPMDGGNGSEPRDDSKMTNQPGICRGLSHFITDGAPQPPSWKKNRPLATLDNKSHPEGHGRESHGLLLLLFQEFFSFLR